MRAGPSLPLIQVMRFRGFYVSFSNTSHLAQQTVPENPLGQKAEPIEIPMVPNYETSRSFNPWKMAPFSPSLLWDILILAQGNGLKLN